MRAIFFVLLLLPFVIPVLVDDAFAADWYSTSWEYRKKIEVSLNSAPFRFIKFSSTSISN